MGSFDCRSLVVLVFTSGLLLAGVCAVGQEPQRGAIKRPLDGLSTTDFQDLDGKDPWLLVWPILSNPEDSGGSGVSVPHVLGDQSWKITKTVEGVRYEYGYDALGEVTLTKTRSLYCNFWDDASGNLLGQYMTHLPEKELVEKNWADLVDTENFLQSVQYNHPKKHFLFYFRWHHPEDPATQRRLPASVSRRLNPRP